MSEKNRAQRIVKEVVATADIVELSLAMVALDERAAKNLQVALAKALIGSKVYKTPSE